MKNKIPRGPTEYQFQVNIADHQHSVINHHIPIIIIANIYFRKSERESFLGSGEEFGVSIRKTRLRCIT